MFFIPFLGICILSQHIAGCRVPYRTLASDIEFVDAIPKRAKIVLATCPNMSLNLAYFLALYFLIDLIYYYF